LELPSVLVRYRGDLDAFLRSTLPQQVGAPLLYRMMRYHLGWEDAEGRPLTGADGKGLRSSLCLWACQAAGGNWRAALPAAAAVELVHNFSLVHDDIQDGDRQRRHRPTVWSLWGQPQAINAGDSLLALARLTLLRLSDCGVEPARVVRACRILDEGCLAMIEGQCLDIGFEEESQVSLEAYLEMIARKTGALFAAALHLGALVGSDDQPAAGAAFARCGRLLGMAFQMRDDVLGTWGREEATGKPAAADIRGRKKSLPLVYALATATGETRDALLRLYAQEMLADADVRQVVAILDGLVARQRCQALARQHFDQALAEVAAIGIEPGAYHELREAGEFLLEREF